MIGTLARATALRWPSAALPADGPPTALATAAGWLVYLWVLLFLADSLPTGAFTPGHQKFLMILGALGVWRYGLGMVHFSRAMLFLHVAFPRARARARELGEAALPSHAYFLVTSFRIEATTTADVYRAAIAEAIGCGRPATVVASIVELADERLIRTLWRRMNPPERVQLQIVRIPGTGKRDGLAHGFRAIARTNPATDAVVAVIDGDTVVRPGLIRDCAPFFKLFPSVGALTTNEFCDVEGRPIMRSWHQLRFAQRHLNMCSMALGKHVLTLTGRMSLFRAPVVTDPEFIDDVQNDHLDHWRLGRFKFLTGDDKSSWYSLVRHGWDTYYVPDVAIDTLEHPPHKSFFTSSRMLMFRWYGNSLRQNYRAVKLGPKTLGWFTYYVLWDQRVTMWTSLFGITAAIIASLKYGATVLIAYFVWVGMSRLYLTLILIASGHKVGPLYPILLYYNQILGALIKVRVFFNLDQQSWTRQRTRLARDLDGFERWFNRGSSEVMTASAASLFLVFVFHLV
ncbi:MAG TPA: glycosyltransferase family 2 protein [Verrucomicrobiae bacterium]|nr:glycosyltransferase family 2 protein [Verrucomicrobiae bacterium]